MEMTRIGTVQDPIPIYSLVSDRSLLKPSDEGGRAETGYARCSRAKRGTSCRRPLSLSCSDSRCPQSSVLASLKPRTSDIADLQFPERHVGCTGFPADSHDTIWMLVNDKIKNHRCPECGCGMSTFFPSSMFLPLHPLGVSGLRPLRHRRVLICSLQAQLPR
jgi:hypothetical protein